MNPHISVVIPVYNEQATLPELIDRCIRACEATGRAWELILVDDGSDDGSVDVIEAAARRHQGRVIGVLLNRNYGQHSALTAGFERVSGQVVITLDADLQNPPEEIGRLVEKIDAGYDVVGSVRVNRRDPIYRRLFSSMINYTVRRVTGVMMHDYGCMLRAYRRPIVDAMLGCPERNTFIPVLANTFARRTTEIEVSHAERAAGASKYSFWKLLNLQFDLLTSMTTLPLRLLVRDRPRYIVSAVLGPVTNTARREDHARTEPPLVVSATAAGEPRAGRGSP